MRYQILYGPARIIYKVTMEHDFGRPNQISEKVGLSSSSSFNDIPCHIANSGSNKQADDGNYLILGICTHQSTYKHMYGEARNKQSKNRGEQENQYFDHHGCLLGALAGDAFLTCKITPPICKAIVSTFPASIAARLCESELLTGSRGSKTR